MPDADAGAMKRMLDVVGAAGGLAFFALPMAIVAAAILIDDGPEDRARLDPVPLGLIHYLGGQAKPPRQGAYARLRVAKALCPPTGHAALCPPCGRGSI
jgi:hypothetical protein